MVENNKKVLYRTYFNITSVVAEGSENNIKEITNENMTQIWLHLQVISYGRKPYNTPKKVFKLPVQYEGDQKTIFNITLIWLYFHCTLHEEHKQFAQTPN